MHPRRSSAPTPPDLVFAIVAVFMAGCEDDALRCVGVKHLPGVAPWTRSRAMNPHFGAKKTAPVDGGGIVAYERIGESARPEAG